MPSPDLLAEPKALASEKLKHRLHQARSALQPCADPATILQEPDMLNKTSLAAAEADLAALTKRAAALEQRRDAAAVALATATAERRRLLTETDEPDPKALTAADKTVRAADDAHGAAVDALAEVDRRAIEVRVTVESLKAEAERERHAVAIEASAREVDAAVERIRKAAGELDSARRDLAAALLPEAVACYAPPSNAVAYGPQYLTTALFYDSQGEPVREDLGTEQVAARIVGHLVSTALPDLGVARLADVTKMHAGGGSTHVLAPVDGDVARSLLTDPMRAAAAKVREGLPGPVLGSGRKPPRRRADGWTTDKEGRSFDKAGVPVTPSGFYLDDGEADQSQPHPLMLGAVSRPVKGEVAA